MNLRIPKFHGRFRHIETDWKAAVSGSALGDFSNWDTALPGRKVDHVEGDNSQVFRVETDRGTVVFKRYTPKKPYRYFLRRSRAANEWTGLNALAQAGIRVPGLIGFGEDRVWGGLQAGYVITREIADAEDLAIFAARHWIDLDRAARKSMLDDLQDQLFSMIRRAHTLNLFHQDLNWRNILVTHDHEGFRLWWIDCPKFRSGPLNRNHATLVDLSCLSRVALSLLSRTQRFRSLLAFFEGDRPLTRRYFREIENHHKRSRHPPRAFDPATLTYKTTPD